MATLSRPFLEALQFTKTRKPSTRVRASPNSLLGWGNTRLAEADERRFFNGMSTIWKLNDQYDLNVPTTSFLFFGGQKATKSSQIERKVGFPVTVIGALLGTLRPLVVMLLSLFLRLMVRFVGHAAREPGVQGDNELHAKGRITFCSSEL